MGILEAGRGVVNAGKGWGGFRKKNELTLRQEARERRIILNLKM
jgi:hypothetical protein